MNEKSDCTIIIERQDNGGINHLNYKTLRGSEIRTFSINSDFVRAVYQ